MAKDKIKKAENRKLWADIDVKRDFVDALKDVEEVDLAEYNEKAMLLFSANVNYARHLLRLSDSLKPVHRRVLYMMYVNGLKNGNKKKSVSIVGSTTDIHPHGSASIYSTIVGLGQYWKTAIPLIKIVGSYGTEVSGIYAADRYTEATMSDYAYKCFFQDFDTDCVQMMFNTAAGKNEPVSLPSRYPNILINGGSGIAVGNSFKIAPYNVGDVIRETKKRLRNPHGHVYMIPDLPTGCDIVDDGNSIKQICETGRGTLRMRAHIDIVDEGKHWALHVTNLPWGVSLENVHASLVKITKAGILPIKEVQDRHEQIILEDGRTVVSHVDHWILVDKAHDPYAVRDKLYKKTQLEENAPINFKVVLEELKLGNFSLAELIDTWIDQRREYKRRLLNKRIARCTSEVETFKILIEIMSGNNLQQTVDIIRKSAEDQVVDNLIKKYGMSSFQASKIADMKMTTFNADAPKKYRALLEEKKKEIASLYEMVRSEKAIDDIIAVELDELKKYVTERKSPVVTDTGVSMDMESEYFLICTKKGCLKKVSVDAVARSKRGFGAYESGDFPTAMLRGTNMDAILFIDSFGKFSVVKMADIPTASLNDYPVKSYDILKLEGEIIAMRFFQDSERLTTLKNEFKVDLYLITFSRQGVAKRVNLESILEQCDDGRKTVRNARLTKLKDKDVLANADYYVGSAKIVIYTKQGEYNYVTADMVPEYGRDAVGRELVRLQGNDQCVGACAISDNTNFVVLVTKKGKAKKCEVEYLGVPSPDKATSYIIDVEPGDELIYADAPLEGIDVMTKMTHYEFALDDIRTLGRKAKGAKKVPLQPGDSIIQVVTK